MKSDDRMGGDGIADSHIRNCYSLCHRALGKARPFPPSWAMCPAPLTLDTRSHVTDEMRQRAAEKIGQGIAKAGVEPQEEKPKQTMNAFQARKRWSRKAG